MEIAVSVQYLIGLYLVSVWYFRLLRHKKRTPKSPYFTCFIIACLIAFSVVSKFSRGIIAR